MFLPRELNSSGLAEGDEGHITQMWLSAHRHGPDPLGEDYFHLTPRDGAALTKYTQETAESNVILQSCQSPHLLKKNTFFKQKVMLYL